MEDGLKLCLKIAAKIGYTQTQTQRQTHIFYVKKQLHNINNKRNSDNDLFPCYCRARSTERTESEVKEPTLR